MKRFYGLLLVIMTLSLSACVSISRIYQQANAWGTTVSKGDPWLVNHTELFLDSFYLFPFVILQPVLPYPVEKYIVKSSFTNSLDESDGLGDMLYMYIDEARVVLPSGKAINLLDKKITMVYAYRSTPGEITSSEWHKGKPEVWNGAKRLLIDGLGYAYENSHFFGDNVLICFSNVRIPAYFINTVRVEYSLTMVFENRGEVRLGLWYVFDKKIHKFYGL